MTKPTNERAFTMLGVEGRMFARHDRTNGTFASQIFVHVALL